MKVPCIEYKMGYIITEKLHLRYLIGYIIVCETVKKKKHIRWLVNFRIKDINNKTPNFTFLGVKLGVNLVNH
jgi:hypothetical protein